MPTVELNNSAKLEDATSWICSVCGQARLCPYAAPCLSDARVACRSCGDLLVHGNTPAPRAVSNLEVW